MPHPLQIFSQSDYLIRIVDINLHTEWQTVQIQISWLLRNQLIWIYTVSKDRKYPGSTGQGLRWWFLCCSNSSGAVARCIAARVTFCFTFHVSCFIVLIVIRAC